MKMTIWAVSAGLLLTALLVPVRAQDDAPEAKPAGAAPRWTLAETWRDAGQETPEAAYMTLSWATRKCDTEKMRACMGPEYAGYLDALAKGSEGDRAQVKAFSALTVAYCITSKRAIDSNRVGLAVELRRISGGRTEIVDGAVLLKRFDGQWRAVGSPTQQTPRKTETPDPVSEEAERRAAEARKAAQDAAAKAARDARLRAAKAERERCRREQRAADR